MNRSNRAHDFFLQIVENHQRLSLKASPFSDEIAVCFFKTRERMKAQRVPPPSVATSSIGSPGRRDQHSNFLAVLPILIAMVRD